MNNTIISWSDLSWNPVTGCSKLSSGCKNCYAERTANWLHRMRNPRYKNNFQVTLHSDKVNEPYSWKKPQMVFVNSMSDLFHPNVPMDFIKSVFKAMADNPQHIFQVLTKRSERLVELSSELEWSDNIWMGVSVEDENARHRIDDLRKVPAKLRFLSIEPLLSELADLNLSGIGWIIVGGESGPKARLMKPEWVKDLEIQCRHADVPFFFKQWGEHRISKHDPTDKKNGGTVTGGHLLNGRVYNEYPKETERILSADSKGVK